MSKLRCSTCLSPDRTLNLIGHLYDVYRLVVDCDNTDETDKRKCLDYHQRVCWECEAILTKFLAFRRRAHQAMQLLELCSPEHIAMKTENISLDRTYEIVSLSPLKIVNKSHLDKEYIHDDDLEDSNDELNDNKQEENVQIKEITKNNNNNNTNTYICREEPAFDVVHKSVMISTDTLISNLKSLNNKDNTVIKVKNRSRDNLGRVKSKRKTSKYFNVVTMSEVEMLAVREDTKLRPQYVGSEFKCELCISGFYNAGLLYDHNGVNHKKKRGFKECSICFVYVQQNRLESHRLSHYHRYQCTLCGFQEYDLKSMQRHIKAVHKNAMESAEDQPKYKRRMMLANRNELGYPCNQCNSYYKTARMRRSHIQICHKEKLECDLCHKKFIDRSSLKKHLRLHQGTMPRVACELCHKEVGLTAIRNHMQLHQTRNTYTCVPCGKTYTRLETYQWHLKYSRTHATDDVLRFTCPMCNKSFKEKDEMQDHFNYNHLGKTQHKCAVCEKPLATQRSLGRHMKHVHNKSKDLKRDKMCNYCGKAFSSNVILAEHEAIHTGARPLSCDVCGMTFRQRAALYTHRKRVHKLLCAKKTITFMDSSENEKNIK